jgi:hypothetical protein
MSSSWKAAHYPIILVMVGGAEKLDARVFIA